MVWVPYFAILLLVFRKRSIVGTFQFSTSTSTNKIGLSLRKATGRLPWTFCQSLKLNWSGACVSSSSSYASVPGTMLFDFWWRWYSLVEKFFPLVLHWCRRGYSSAVKAFWVMIVVWSMQRGGWLLSGGVRPRCVCSWCSCVGLRLDSVEEM